MIEAGALILSLKLAIVTSFILLLIGVPLAYVLARSRSRFTNFFETLFLMPIVLPPTVLGFYLLLALSQTGLAFTFTGLVIGSLIYSFAFAFQSFVNGFKGIRTDFFDVSMTLGDSPLQTFFRVALPLAKDSILVGALLSFAHTLGEFGAVLMIGGNIPGVTRTLSISVYDQVQALDYKSAHQTSIFLLIFSFVILFIIALTKKPVRFG